MTEEVMFVLMYQENESTKPEIYNCSYEEQIKLVNEYKEKGTLTLFDVLKRDSDVVKPIGLYVSQGVYFSKNSGTENVQLG